MTACTLKHEDLLALYSAVSAIEVIAYECCVKIVGSL
jgi:hypothetical protein